MTPRTIRSDGWVSVLAVALLLVAIAAALEWGGLG